jgi:hypothetical protein
LSDELPSQGLCPDCGAENAQTASRCWMCGRRAPLAEAPEHGDRLSDPASPSPDGSSLWVVHQTELALLVLVTVVTVGVWQYSVFYGLLMLLVIDLPLLMTVGAVMVRYAQHRSQVEQYADLPPGVERPLVTVRPMTGGEQMGLFLKWLLAMAGSLLLLAGLAFIVICVLLVSLITALAEICSSCGPQ